jgi:hypothetical protein
MGFTVQSLRDDHLEPSHNPMKPIDLARWPTTLALLSLLAVCNYPPSAPATPTEALSISTQTVEAVLTLAPTEPPASLPKTRTPELPATEVIIGATPTPAVCTHRAAFVADATYPDDTEVEPAEDFLKIWTLRNNGTCTWTPDYSVVFYGGARLSAPAELPLNKTVEPDETVNVAVDLVAPSKPGVYQGFWRLRDDQGDLFGIGPGAEQSFWVKIVVPASPTLAVTATSTPSATASATPSTTAISSPTPSASVTASATPTATATASPTTSPTSTATP